MNLSIDCKPNRSKLRKFKSLPESMRLLKEMKAKANTDNNLSQKNDEEDREVEYLFVKPKVSKSKINIKEFCIHSLLDSIGIFQINISEALRK